MLTQGADSDLDVEDADVAFDSQDKDIKPSKKSYEVDFKVYSPADIQAYQNRVIDEVSQILGQPAESTAILLRYARWNKERLIEQYMDKQEELLEDAGLGDDVEGVVKISKAGADFMCDICADDDAELDTFAMKCGHKFCVPCWKQYLYTKIKDEGEAARIKCPGTDCNRIVDSKSLELLVAADLKDRYVPLDFSQQHPICHGLTVALQVPRLADEDVRRRQGEPEVVSGAELRVRRGLPGEAEGPLTDRAHGHLRLQAPLLLRLFAERPPAGAVRFGEEVAQEVRGRLGDGQLDLGQHQGMPKVPLDD